MVGMVVSGGVVVLHGRSSNCSRRSSLNEERYNGSV